MQGTEMSAIKLNPKRSSLGYIIIKSSKNEEQINSKRQRNKREFQFGHQQIPQLKFTDQARMN
jgi:hypothetical protein